jgi:hypothetical protein
MIESRVCVFCKVCEASGERVDLTRLLKVCLTIACNGARYRGIVQELLSRYIHQKTKIAKEK